MRSCLPWRRLLVATAMFLLALEESGPCVLACPGGEWSVLFFNLPGKTKPAIVWTHSLNFDWLLTDFCS